MRTDPELDAADAARRRLGGRLVAVEPDSRVAPYLVPNEDLIAIRRGVLLDRRAVARGDPGSGPSGLAGDLYLTTRRLLHLGGSAVEIPLAEILEAIVATDVLWLLLSEGGGVALRVTDPMVLRVELAATRRELARPTGPSGGPRAPVPPSTGYEPSR
jgi:hypothetical protein